LVSLTNFVSCFSVSSILESLYSLWRINSYAFNSSPVDVLTSITSSGTRTKKPSPQRKNSFNVSQSLDGYFLLKSAFQWSTCSSENVYPNSRRAFYKSLKDKPNPYWA